MATKTRQEWNQRYSEGCTPWDTRITPPEVKAFWSSDRLPHTGTAIDLGCGPGTNVAYLASLGLFAIGIDFAGLALARARQRLASKGPHMNSRTALIHADVTALPFQEISATYVLDIGCLHGLPKHVRPSYAAGIAENLAPGGYYQLFGFDSTPDTEAENNDRGLDTNEVAQLLAPELEVVEIIRGNPDHRPCRWYLLRRV